MGFGSVRGKLDRTSIKDALKAGARVNVWTVNEPRQMRAAMRLRNWPFFRNQTLGFRIARDLAP